jgi:repressor LexA
MEDLTNRQKQILEFIKSQSEAKGYPPSIREIANQVGLNSSGTVHFHLRKLEALGYIKRDPSKPRTIEVVHNNDLIGFNQEILELPVVEKIYGSANPVSKKNTIETIKLPASLIVGENNFILKYKDEKMIDAGILKNDFLVVNRVENLKENKIAVFLIKYFKTVVGRYSIKDEENIIIKFDNCFEDPLVIPKNEVNIIGQVTGVFRSIK